MISALFYLGVDASCALDLIPMEICLVQPPIEDFYTTAIRNVPLGLLLLAATLGRHEVQLIDLRRAKGRPIPVPAALQGVTGYYRPEDESPFGLYKCYQRFGLNREAIERLLPLDTQLFVISALFTTYADTVYELCDIIRTKTPEAKIVVGGHHATVLPLEVLNAGADYVIRGEGEAALPRLVEELDQNSPDLARVPNLVWRTAEGELRINSQEMITNLDTLPFADYTKVKMPRKKRSMSPMAMLMTSRGCPYHCTFCGIHRTMGRRYRLRSVEHVLEEMKRLYRLGYRAFDFEDDHFGGEQSWLQQFLQAVIAQFGERQLHLTAMNGITATNLTEEVLELMQRAGFRSLNISLVTPASGRQHLLHRPVDTEQAIRIIAQAHEIGLMVTVYLIIGLWGESAQEILKAILFLASQPALIGPSLFYLVPGTAVFEELEQRGLIPEDRRQYRSSYYPVETTDCDRQAAMTLFRLCRIFNFLKQLCDESGEWIGAEIKEDALILPPLLSGRERRRRIGVTLLRQLFEKGLLLGTCRAKDNRVLLVPEKVDQDLVDLFLRENWVVKGVNTGRVLSKDEVREKLGLRRY